MGTDDQKPIEVDEQLLLRFIEALARDAASYEFKRLLRERDNRDKTNNEKQQNPKQ
jgi:hypothetical protein